MFMRIMIFLSKNRMNSCYCGLIENLKSGFCFGVGVVRFGVGDIIIEGSWGELMVLRLNSRLVVRFW